MLLYWYSNTSVSLHSLHYNNNRKVYLPAAPRALLQQTQHSRQVYDLLISVEKHDCGLRQHKKNLQAPATLQHKNGQLQGRVGCILIAKLNKYPVDVHQQKQLPANYWFLQCAVSKLGAKSTSFLCAANLCFLNNIPHKPLNSKTNQLITSIEVQVEQKT